MTVYYIYREFLGPLVSGALTEFFDFQSSAVVSERDKINFLLISIVVIIKLILSCCSFLVKYC